MTKRPSLDRIDVIAASTLRFAIACIGPVAIAIAVGATLFAATHAELLEPLFDNRLSEAQRYVALAYMGGATLGVAILYIGILLAWRRRGSSTAFDGALRISRSLSFLMSGPAIVALTEPSIEVRHTWRTWLYIGVAVAAWWPTFRQIGEWGLRKARAPRLSSRHRDWMGLLFASMVAAAYAFFFARIAIINHHSFNTRVFDLGLYDNIFFRSSHGDPLGCSFLRGGTHAAAHFDPILVLLSPLYRLSPGPEFLLVLQAVWCGFGAIGAYLLGRQQLDSWLWGVAWALVYALHPALHGANLYEFHSLTLAISPLLFALYFLLSGRSRLYLMTLALLLLIREDVSLLMCFVGLFGMISEDRNLKRLGWITIVVCLAYFIVAKTVFMSSPELFNQGKGSYGFAYYYKEMIPNKLGAGDFFISLLTNPAYVLALITKEDKLQYLMVVFFPLLFLPAWAGRARVMLLYGLIFILLASRRPVYSPHFQYSTVLLPVALALAPVGLRRLQGMHRSNPHLTATVMGCVLVASLLASWKFGGIVENESFRGGFTKPRRNWDEQTMERYESFRAMVSEIGPDASVSATDRVGSHISNRFDAHLLDQDVATDYFLVHSSDLRGRSRTVLDARKKARTIELVEREGPWLLYRAVPPPETE